jgi:hypothetical protein
MHPFRPHDPARLLAQLPLLTLVILTLGCRPAPPAETDAEPAPADEAVRAEPRVFFIEPADGATVTSPVHFRFGIEHFEIAPVPAGEVDVVRHGMGHHHLGVDTECLPAGSIVPQANPWIHFGDGRTEIDMQLPPGRHTFALQIGDDEHRTIEGLCSTITVTVEGAEVAEIPGS